LFVFKKIKAKKRGDFDSFVLDKRIVVKEIPIFNQVTPSFFFKNFPVGTRP
jgi:hypothetical protein